VGERERYKKRVKRGVRVEDNKRRVGGGVKREMGGDEGRSGIEVKKGAGNRNKHGEGERGVGC